MSDVFISYAREDRALAQTLAKELEGRGYRVWWDAELVGSDDFQEVILAALAKARAAVVIWSKASVKSHFVRDEARYALHYKKLVAVREPGLEVLDIPFGFQGQHTDDLDNREQIVRAIAKLGAAPATKQASAPQTGTTPDTWESVQSTRDVDVLLGWLERNPAHDKRSEAFQRMRLLMDADNGSAAQKKPARVARMSNWSAFLSGLTFRIPSFQLATQGNWSSIGFSIGLVALLLVGLGLALFLTIALEQALQKAGFSPIEADQIGLPSFSLALLLLVWFAKARFAAWVGQRNFIAAWIVAPFLALLAGGLAFYLMVSVFIFSHSAKRDVFSNIPLGRAGGLIVFAIGALLAVIYIARKVRSAR